MSLVVAGGHKFQKDELWRSRKMCGTVAPQFGKHWMWCQLFFIFPLFILYPIEENELSQGNRGRKEPPCGIRNQRSVSVSHPHLPLNTRPNTTMTIIKAS